MKNKLIKSILILVIICSGITLAYAWGSWGHKHITRSAVFALPEGMIKFYYNHIDFITEGAVVPDLRKYVINDKVEGPRHYVDIEDFNIPISSIPKTTKEAYTKYDSAFLEKTGYLPWYIQNMTEKLTQAFKKRNKSEILFISTELSHYIGDATMPLHISSNHDGQKTNQRGVHALWESVLPAAFGQNYNFNTGPAKYIDNITDETWKIIEQSHALIPQLLAAEMKVRKSFTPETMYKKDSAGNTVLSFKSPVFSDAYAAMFHKELNGMVESQLRKAIQETSSFWYTAWVNAGSPDLISLDDPHLTKQNRKNFKKEFKAWKKGKILNLGGVKEM